MNLTDSFISPGFRIVSQLLFFLLLANLASHHPVLSFSYHRLRAGCMLMTNEDWEKPHSLILNADKTKIIHPEDKDSVYLSPLEDIVLACPGSKLTIKDTSTASAKCDRGTQITVDQSEYEFKTASCEKLPMTTARVTGRCYNNSDILKVEIGFELESSFINLIDICFDDRTLATNYSRYEASYRIAGRQHGFPRTYFLEAGFYHKIKVWELYKRRKQRETISEILGSTELGEEYIKDDNKYYLARGHLTAKADFIYGAEQMATFYYINVAPQWQIINAGNWATLEDNVRSHIVDEKLEISIYTVPYGIAQLPNKNGKYTDLYLYKDEDGKQLIAVPKLYIKIVFNPDEKTGVAFLTVNNPYVSLEEIQQRDYIICKDVCDQISWLTWDRTNIKKGYSYCCDYKNVRDTVEGLPYIPIEKLMI